MKWLGWTIKITLGLALVLVIGITVLLLTFDANKYRDQISQIVQDQTGRELSLDDISLTLYPTIGLAITNAQLSNAAGFEEPTMVNIAQMRIGVALMPLLRQELAVDTLELNGLAVYLARNADGTTNWQDLLPEPETSQPAEQIQSATEPAPTDTDALIAQLQNLAIDGIGIQNASFIWDDQASQQRIELDDLNISTTAIKLNQFFNLSLAGNLAVQDPQLNLNWQLAIDVKVDNQLSLSLKDLTAQLDLNSRELPVTQSRVNLALPTIVLDLEQQMFNLNDLSLKLAAQFNDSLPIASVTGQSDIQAVTLNLTEQQLTLPEFALTLNAKGPTQSSDEKLLNSLDLNLNFAGLNAKLDTQTLSLPSIVLNGAIDSPLLPVGKTDFDLRTQLQANLSEQTLTVDSLRLALLDLVLTSRIAITQLQTTPTITSELAIDTFNLRKLLTQLQVELPEMAKANTLEKLALSFNSRVTLGEAAPDIAINNLKLDLDNSQLTGQAQVQPGDSLLARWNLALNQINLNDYLPPKSEGVEPEPKPDDQPEFVLELPNDLLRSLDLDGQIRVGQLTFDQLNMANILVVIKAKEGVVDLSQLRADLFNTQAVASAQLDVRNDQPKMAVKLDSRNIPIGEVISSFVDFDRLSGTGLVQADLTMAGDRISQWQESLNGHVTLNLRDGAVKGFNLAKSVRDAQALFRGQRAQADEGPLQTDFSALDLRATIKQGVVTTERLTAEAPFMRIRGEGTVNLPKQELDYLVRTSIVASAVGQDGADLNNLVGLTIPVKLTGSLVSPRVSLDLASLLESRARQEVEERLRQEQERIQRQIEKQVEEQKEKIGEQIQQQIEERGGEMLENLRRRLPF
ncbi:membrane assembly protein AsmA [Thiomicrospira aerophila AL3]|uniref:Membrane assembly protein AsmA n=1 Tax=Thiomicrospira aerophila AL3 TaxID=717772 RepID=W0DV37_9GAMM|nr:AsmA family protein [Thiomicrospira aerophila]AHF00716.1 membrane assembly protein AsmA [Thiomicrospira aerophila AL3]